jgi:hypothetical protein
MKNAHAGRPTVKGQSHREAAMVIVDLCCNARGEA